MCLTWGTGIRFSDMEQTNDKTTTPFSKADYVKWSGEYLGDDVKKDDSLLPVDFWSLFQDALIEIDAPDDAKYYNWRQVSLSSYADLEDEKADILPIIVEFEGEDRYIKPKRILRDALKAVVWAANEAFAADGLTQFRCEINQYKNGVDLVYIY